MVYITGQDREKEEKELERERFCGCFLDREKRLYFSSL
jgi:hypothetical protein